MVVGNVVGASVGTIDGALLDGDNVGDVVGDDVGLVPASKLTFDEVGYEFDKIGISAAAAVRLI
jgi:hypothetical protein